MALSKKVTRISEWLAKWLEDESKKTGASESAIIAMAVQEMRERKDG